MIEYYQNPSLERIQVLDLYNDANWTAYTKDPARLLRAIEHSHWVAAAFENNKLVGLIRTISDEETIVSIQDILVHTNHQRKGIGTKLIEMCKQQYSDVRQMVLLTDDTDKTRKFYKSLGFQSADDGRLVGFTSLRTPV